MITALTFSEVGGHASNQDACVAHRHPLDLNAWICFVADGQGGQPGGGEAARLACETAVKFAEKYRVEELVKQRTWSSLLREVDGAVLADSTAGFTTFVGLCVTNESIVGTSSGDSAAILFTEKSELELTANQRKNPPIGSGAAASVSFHATLCTPWRLLVMTDGVWKYAGWEKVKEAAKLESFATVIPGLERAARLLRSGLFQDDFTVVLLEDSGESAIAG